MELANELSESDNTFTRAELLKARGYTISHRPAAASSNAAKERPAQSFQVGSQGVLRPVGTSTFAEKASAPQGGQSAGAFSEGVASTSATGTPAIAGGDSVLAGVSVAGAESERSTPVPTAQAFRRLPRSLTYKRDEGPGSTPSPRPRNAT